jgi:voltage-gated potassium channel
VVFLVDYVARLTLATDRPRWFFRRLLDLAIVTLPLLRPLRLLRLVVLVGVLQKVIGGAVRGRVAIFTFFGVILLVYCASLAISKPNVRSPTPTSGTSAMPCGGRLPPSPRRAAICTLSPSRVE